MNSEIGYATLGAASAQRAEPIKPLEGIGADADRVAHLCQQVAGILDRFHGPTPQMAGNQKDAAVSVSYLTQVSRLHANIEQLQDLVNSLEQSA